MLVLGLSAWLLGGVAVAQTAGLALGDSIATYPAGHSFEWVDSLGRVITNGQCWSGGMTPQPLRNIGTGSLATRVGSDEMILLGPGPNATVTSVSCDHDPVPLGTLPASIVPLLMHDVALTSDQSLWFMTLEGLYRTPTATALDAQLVVSTAALEAEAGMPIQYVLGLTSTPEDRIGLLVQAVDDTTQISRFALVEVDGAANVTLRFGPESRLTVGAEIDFEWSSSLDGYLLDGLRWRGGAEIDRPILGLIRADAPVRFEGASIPPWPFRPLTVELGASGTWVRTIGGSDGRVYAVWDIGSQSLSELLHDPERADFDRDGLRAAAESSLSTSDARVDSDADGFQDGVERELFGTDPASASSSPSIAPSGRSRLAPSTMLRQWSGLPDAECMTPFPYTFGEPLCFANEKSPTCVEAPGDWVCLDAASEPVSSPIPSELQPRWSRDGRTVWRAELGSSGNLEWKPRNSMTGLDIDVPVPAFFDTVGAIPIAEDAAVFVDPTNFALWRVRASGALALVDASRAGCPIVRSEAELARCGAPDLASPTVMGVRVLGFDDARERVVVRISTAQAEGLYEVGVDDFVFAGDVTGLSGPSRWTSLLSLGSGGYVASAHSTAFASYRLDAALRPIADLHQPLINTELPVPPFSAGFRDVIYQGYLREPPFTGIEGGACMVGGVGDFVGGEEGSFQFFVCDSAPLRDFETATIVYPARWVEVDERVETGEILIWSAKRAGGSLSLSVLESDGLFRAQTRDGWFLWRYSRQGGVLEWMDELRFRSSVAPEDQLTFIGASLGPIHAAASSFDGTKVCLVEPLAGRVWELSFDETTRAYLGARLGHEGGATACAYDQSDLLAVASGGAPAQISIGSTILPVEGVNTVLAMARGPSGWVLAVEGGPMTCVSDDGTVSTSARQAIALAPAEDGMIALIDEQDFMLIKPAAEACTGGRLDFERIALGEVWDELYNPWLTQRSVHAPHSSLALRPDGMALLAPRGVYFRENGNHDPSVSPDLLFYLFGAYRPHLGSSYRLGALDRFRITKDLFDLAAREVHAVGALVTIRGANASGDWGYAERPGDPPVVAPDAGAFDAGMNSGGDAGIGNGEMTEEGGCGCTSGAKPAPGPGSIVLAMLLLGCGLRRLRSRPAPKKPSPIA